jgi:Gas vesicle synthesis protein GvpO
MADESDRGRTARNGRDGHMDGADAVRLARAQLEELTGHAAESVSAFRRTDDGWEMRVEVVELERVPPTMNVMGSYDVELDEDGALVGYERVRRYHRGQVDQDEG